MFHHIFIDCMGQYRTDSYSRYAIRLRECFSTPFIQFYLYCVIRVASLYHYRCVCKLRWSGTSVYISTIRSLFDVTGQPVLTLLLVSSDDKYVIEKVGIDEATELNINKITLTDNIELEMLFYALGIINREFYRDFSINISDTLPHIIVKLKEARDQVKKESVLLK